MRASDISLNSKQLLFQGQFCHFKYISDVNKELDARMTWRMPYLPYWHGWTLDAWATVVWWTTAERMQLWAVLVLNTWGEENDDSHNACSPYTAACMHGCDVMYSLVIGILECPREQAALEKCCLWEDGRSAEISGNQFFDSRRSFHWDLLQVICHLV